MYLITHHISISFTSGYKAWNIRNSFKFLLFSLFLLIYRFMLNTQNRGINLNYRFVCQTTRFLLITIQLIRTCFVLGDKICICATLLRILIKIFWSTTVIAIATIMNGTTTTNLICGAVRLTTTLWA